MIRVCAVSKRFVSRPALHDVSLEVGGGEVVLLLGPNGAGKTTLLRILAGMLVPDTGRATVCGHDVVRARRAAASAMGLVLSSEHSWFSRLDAAANLEFFGAAQGLAPRDARSAARETLAQMGLEAHAGKAVGAFSRGMRARLALARALLSDPPVLLLDEPSAALDQASTEGLIDVLQRHRAQRAVLLATHSLAEAHAVGDRALVFRDGAVVHRLDGPLATATLANVVGAA